MMKPAMAILTVLSVIQLLEGKSTAGSINLRLQQCTCTAQTNTIILQSVMGRKEYVSQHSCVLSVHQVSHNEESLNDSNLFVPNCCCKAIINSRKAAKGFYYSYVHDCKVIKCSAF